MQKESDFYGRNNDAGSDLILFSDSIDMEVLSSLPAQQLNCVRDYSYKGTLDWLELR